MKSDLRNETAQPTVDSHSALYLSVCIFQLNSTPLNRSTLNMAEICYQSKVFATNSP